MLEGGWGLPACELVEAAPRWLSSGNGLNDSALLPGAAPPLLPGAGCGKGMPRFPSAAYADCPMLLCLGSNDVPMLPSTGSSDMVIS